MNRRQHAYALAQWVTGGVVAGLICGSASALFLYLLDRATDIRLANELIVFALPVAGLVIGWLYDPGAHGPDGADRHGAYARVWW
jgi:NhaP-type Na+/H+ or K+/H+ antiporter